MERWPYQPPDATFAILDGVAKTGNLHKVRVTGCEPLINKAHLFEVIKMAMEHEYEYVLDTNALSLDEAFLRKLAPYKDSLYIYIGLKGSTPELFEKITKADAKYWFRQLEGLRLVVKHNFRLGINLMATLTPTATLPKLFHVLHDISPILLHWLFPTRRV